MNREIWKEYSLEAYQYINKYKIEISNFGNIRTYNRLAPNGKLVKGSLLHGFPVYKFKLFQEKSEEDKNKVKAIQDQIDAYNLLIKEYKNIKNEDVILEKRKVRDELVQKRKKLNHQLLKKYEIRLSFFVHKAVAELFLDTPSDANKTKVIHKDYNKLNNHVHNLAWASQEEVSARFKNHPKNILRALKKKESVVTNQKLTSSDVLVIKKRLKKGYTLKRLAKQFSVSDMQIHRIKTGENWANVKLLEDIIENK